MIQENTSTQPAIYAALTSFDTRISDLERLKLLTPSQSIKRKGAEENEDDNDFSKT
jgi:hypothetical protein